MKNLSTFLVLALLMITSCSEDDEVIIPECLNPIDCTETNLTTTSVTLNWEDSNEGSMSYNIEYGISGFEQGTGIIINSQTTSINIDNLMVNKAYDYYVQAMCDATSISLWSRDKTFSTLPNPVIPLFLPTLSELNIYSGDLVTLTPSPLAFEYQLSTPLFSDYAHKQRLIALPSGTSMEFVGNGFPNFPDNTLIAKTFFYNIDERSPALGKIIIETRILIKKNGEWELGNYVWNDEQTEATLDVDGATLPVSWIDINGDSNNVDYEIPSNGDCFTCHSNSDLETPIGPKLRTLNFEVNGENQLQTLINNNMLSGLTDPTAVTSLPNWEDTNISLEDRTRAYFDINCAHCHQPGGFCYGSLADNQSDLDFSFETAIDGTNILTSADDIRIRVTTNIPLWSMPYIGTTILHEEGVALIEEYLDTL